MCSEEQRKGIQENKSAAECSKLLTSCIIRKIADRTRLPQVDLPPGWLAASSC